MSNWAWIIVPILGVLINVIVYKDYAKIESRAFKSLAVTFIFYLGYMIGMILGDIYNKQ